MAEDGILAFKFDKFDDSAEKEFDFWANSTNIIRETQTRGETEETRGEAGELPTGDFDGFQFNESFDLM